MPAHRTCLDDRGRQVNVPSPLDHNERFAQTPRGKSLVRAREELFVTPTWNLYRWPVAIVVAVLVWYTIRGFEWLNNFNDAPIGRFIVRFPVALFAGVAVFRTLPRTYAHPASRRRSSQALVSALSARPA